MNNKNTAEWEQTPVRFFLGTVFLIVCVGLFVAAPAARAVGVSPGVLIAENLANGMRLERTVQVSRTDIEQEAVFAVSAGGLSGTYITLPEKTFVIPKGARTYDYTFYISPVAAPNGEHEAVIRFSQQPSASTAEGTAAISVQTGVQMSVRFTVTDREVKAFSVQDAYIDLTEVGQPINLAYKVKNEGNVNARPDRIVLDITDRTDETFQVQLEVEELKIPLAPPVAITESSVPIRHTIPAGSYATHVRFYSEGKEIHTQPLELSIYPPGTLAQEANFSQFTVEQEDVVIGQEVRFNALIANSGETPIEAQLYIDIFREGEKIDFLRADQKYIPKNRNAHYSATFLPEELGEYKAVAFFEYGISQTEKKEIPFHVVKPQAEGLLGMLRTHVLAIGVGALLLILIGVVITLVHKLNKNHVAAGSAAPQQPPMPPVAPQVQPRPPVPPPAPMITIPKVDDVLLESVQRPGSNDRS